MNYKKYQRNKKEWLWLFFIWGGLSLFFGLLFYKSWKGAFLLLPFFLIYEKTDRKKKIEKRKKALEEQFAEALQVLIGGLKSGKSLETSVFLIRERLADIYEEEAFIMEEFSAMERGLRMNVPIETLISDLGERSGVRDIKEFADVCAVSKRAGGNLIQVMENTISFLLDKEEMEREIEALISGKKLEAKVIGFILPAILFYMNLAMPDMTKVLYHNRTGIVIMSGVLLCYGACLIWLEKLTAVNV